MRILIVGAGAIGSVIGGLMAKAGHDVTLLGRPAHMEAIDRFGLRITGIWGKHRVTNVKTTTVSEHIGSDAFDWAFITVKSYDTEAAIREVASRLGAKTLVCSYQNGLGNVETIASEVGWPRTVGARAIFGSWIPEPGRVEVTVIANPSALGILDPATPEERVREMVAAMDAAGIPTVYSDTITTVLWSKVAYNCALNPLSALLDVPYGRLLESDDSRALMERVVHELYAVGHARGVYLEPDTPEAYIKHLFEELIPPTAAHYASMRADFVHQRRTEIDALNGAICRFGAEHGIECPYNATLTALVHAREHLFRP